MFIHHTDRSALVGRCYRVNFCVVVFTGQVKQMITEEDLSDEEHPKMMHIVIPAAYTSGVTLFTLRDSDVGRSLLHAPELPML